MHVQKDLAELIGQIELPYALVKGLFAASPLGLQIYSVAGQSLYVNEAFMQMFGVAPPPEYCVLNDEIAERNGVLPSFKKLSKANPCGFPSLGTTPLNFSR